MAWSGEGASRGRGFRVGGTAGACPGRGGLGSVAGKDHAVTSGGSGATFSGEGFWSFEATLDC